MKKIIFAILAATTIALTVTAQTTNSKVPERFTPQNSAILLVDHQQMTMNWIKSLPAETVKQNLRMLARLGVEEKIPLLITTTMEEQVGATWQDIQTLAPTQYAARIKRGGTINCFLDANFRNAVKATGRQKLVIAGLTTDICLMHTVQGALREGYTIWVVADASGSMTPLADELTYAYLRGLGVTVTGGNSLLSELYTDFGTPDGQKAMQINLEEIVSKLAK
jgi:nicotinamidase-related amidase